MMPAFTLLQQQEPARLQLQTIHERLRLQGTDARMGRPPAAACFRFALSRDDGDLVARVAADAWAAHHLPGISGLDWLHMDAGQLAALTAIEHPLQLLPHGMDYRTARFLSLHVGEVGHPYPVIASEEGDVWVERLDWMLDPASPTCPVRASPTFALPIQLQLGTAYLSVRRLRRLRPRDILLLPAPRLQGCCGSRHLFDFVLDPEHLTVTALHSPSVHIPATDEGASATDIELVHDLAQLPLSLDMTLCRLDITLAELANLQAGSTLPLPEQAHRNVQVMHNGRCVAAGELVQVGHVLGVQLTRTPRLA